MTSGLGLELRSGRVRRCRGRVSVLVRWWGGGVGVAPCVWGVAVLLAAVRVDKMVYL